MHTPAIVRPALELRQALQDGELFTPWAERRCGQRITARVQRENPPYLWAHEADALGMRPEESRAVVRRSGRLVQADGTEAARITATVSVGRAHEADDGLIRQLNTTGIPLGTLLGERGHSVMLWCQPGITEYALYCGRLICCDGVPLALTTEQVPWSWLGRLSTEPAGSR